MTDGRFEYLQGAVKLCPRGVKHFCDGTINKSQTKSEEGLETLPPCPMRKNCPVTLLVKEYEEKHKDE